MKLSADQQAASDTFLNFLLDPNEKEMVIEGHSGSGKSTLTKHLVNEASKITNMLNLLQDENNDLNILATATTNKAAKVLGDKIGKDSTTIHSLLGIRPFTDFTNGKQTLKKTRNYQVVGNSILLIDEASMTDTPLKNLIKESTINCKTVHIGDKYQLNPVFESNCPVFEDTSIKTRAVLKTIMRQSGNSQIPVVGEMYRNTVDTGIFPKYTPNGVDIIQCDGSTFQSLIDAEFRNFNDPEQAKILAWTNDRVNQYNEYIYQMQGKTSLYNPGDILIANSPVINGNNYVLFTDDLYKVHSISEINYKGIDCYLLTKSKYDDNPIPVPKDKQEFKNHLKYLAREAKKASKVGDTSVASKLWRTFYELQESIGDLRPIFSSTTHKAQGSTYRNVYIDLPDIGRNNKWNEVARILYVAITRASEKVFLYGQLPERYRG